MKKTRPNIVLLVMDTARAQNFSCYGYSRKTTPNIDQLACNGILFENAITASPWTLPSHGALFTGLHPSIIGLTKVGDILSNNCFMMQEIIKQNTDYVTLCITNNSYIGKMSGLNRGFDIFHEPVPNFQNVRPKLLRKALWRILGKWKDEKYEIGAEKSNKLIQKYIRDLTSDNKPYFLFINYMDSHVPYLSPKEYRYKFINDDINPKNIDRINQDVWGYLAGKSEMSEGDFHILRALYDGQIRYLDHFVGELIKFLKKINRFDNTLFMVTSDHGENLGEHGLMGHVHNLYDTVLRVPLIINYPALGNGGKRIEGQVSLIDIFPTVLDLLGISFENEKYPYTRSLFKSIEENKGHKFVFSEYPYPQLEAFKRRFNEFNYSNYNRSLRAIRTMKSKFIWSSNGKHEFYEIESDPSESNNLFNNKIESQKFLKTKLDEYMKYIDKKAVKPDGKSLDESIAQKLQALGYL